MNEEIPNCYLYQATTTTGGTCQVLVPFGQNPAPYFLEESNENIIEGDWKQVAIVYACTIHKLINT
jgi:hypothetical protein